MIDFLPLWILGVPLALALVDLVASRSDRQESYYDMGATGRHVGVRSELRRDDAVVAPVHGARREHPAVNVS